MNTRMLLALSCAIGALMTGCGSTPHPRNEFPHRIPFQLGDTEFAGQDNIQIREIWGKIPEYAPGGRYLVRGNYRLDSMERAKLFLGTTVASPEKPGPLKPGQACDVLRGNGEFELVHEMAAPGYPHLTFYNPSGSPFGGVYFGTGQTVCRDKGFRYKSP